MNDRHVVLGATGGIGTAVLHALTRRGLPTRAVSRAGAPGRPGETCAADVATPEGARRAVEGAAVVYHCAQPEYTRWPQEFPAMNRCVADACAAAGARLVFADNLYMYGPVDGPISEQSSQRPGSRKGRLRKQLADELLARHAAGELSVTIGRASDYFGPDGVDSTPAALVFEPLARGKRPRWLGRLDVPHSLHYLPDVGEALVELGLSGSSDGRAWVLPTFEARTGREWVQAALDAAGRHGDRPGLVTPWMNRMAGVFIPVVRELNDIMYQFTEPFVVDDSAFRAAFPASPATDPDTAVDETVRWHQQHRQVR